MLRRTFILVLALCAFAAPPCLAQDNWQEQAARLATLLDWRPGSVVAEIGAGGGQLTTLAAKRVGPAGKVYSTELDETEFVHLQQLAAKKRNITAVKAGESDTNLPPACCDSIFMRLVYHHLTKPADIGASLFRSLKPGGRLAIIDEDPAEGTTVPPGVPENRGGHGIPQKILTAELAAAGFEVEKVQTDWPGRDKQHQLYCIVFHKAKP